MSIHSVVGNIAYILMYCLTVNEITSNTLLQHTIFTGISSRLCNTLRGGKQ